jgi:hypothetical protein
MMAPSVIPNVQTRILTMRLRPAFRRRSFFAVLLHAEWHPCNTQANRLGPGAKPAIDQST